MKYNELNIRLEARDEGAYGVFASGEAGEAVGFFSLPFSDLELENFVLRVGRTRRGTRRLESPEMQRAREFGGHLFDALFSSRVRDLYRDCFASARADGKGLRLKLSLGQAPELTDVPWEYLFDSPAFLSISQFTPVIRYLELPRARPPLAVEHPLRVLVMISAPTDAVALDVEEERRKVEQALHERLVERDLVEITWLEQATLRALQRELRHGPYHVFHFIGHGAYDPTLGESVLLLEDEEGRGKPVSGTQLGTMLADHTSLRLAILNACEGARTSRDDPFSGVAAALVQHELPAVIAMQFEITDRAAIIFAEEFYAALVDGLPVDAALAETRKAIYADGNDIEWGTPVLFMRVRDGRLFELPTLPADVPVTPVRVEEERVAQEQAEAERLKQEQAEREEAERVATELAEEERLAKEQAAREKERLAREQTEREEAERVAQEQAEAERLANEQAAREKERLAREQAEREEAERVATEQADAERLVRAQAEREEAERPVPVPPPASERIPTLVWWIGAGAAALFVVGVLYPWDKSGADGEVHSWTNRWFPSTGWVTDGLTALSPVMLAVGTLAALAVAYRFRARWLFAGLLIGLGIAGAGKYGGLVLRMVSFEPSERRPDSLVIFLLVAVAACALIAVGARMALRAPPDRLESTRRQRLADSLVIGGVVLVVLGCLVDFNGAASRNVLFGERRLALDALAAAVGGLVALFIARRNRSVGAGVVFGVGVVSIPLWLRYIGVPIDQGEGMGSWGYGGFLGLAGSLLLVAAGSVFIWRSEPPATSARDESPVLIREGHAP